MNSRRFTSKKIYQQTRYETARAETSSIALAHATARFSVMPSIPRIYVYNSNATALR